MNRKERRAANSKGGQAAYSPEVQQALTQAVQYHQAGRLAEAEPIYRQILANDPDNPDALHLLGLIAYQVGQHEIAVDMISRAIRQRADMSVYHNNLGNAYKELGRIDDAIMSYKRALAIAPQDAEVHNNLGVAWEEKGKYAEALERYRFALSLRPQYTNAHYNMGNAHKKSGDLRAAADSYRRALELDPAYASAANNLGVVLKDLGEMEEAVTWYERALAARPDHIEAFVNLGTLLKDIKRPEEALAYFDRALALRPDYAEAYNNKGLALSELARYDEAIENFNRALSIRPGLVEIINNLGTAYEEQGDFTKASGYYHQALAFDPNCAEAFYNLGNVARKKGKLEEAVKFYERAIAARKDYAEAHWNQAFIRLLSGDLVNGWRESEWRWHRKNMRMHRFTAAPLWDGGDLTGKTILLHAEQGLGDSIHFIRYAPMVKAKGGRVLLACPPALMKLFETVDGIDQMYPDGQGLPAYDVQAPLLSLPGAFATTLDTVPHDVPYMNADPERVAAWRQRLAESPGKKVGIVWRGNPQYKGDRQRSMKAEQYAPFMDLPGISFVSLQKDARSDEIAALGATGPFLNAGPDLHDFADTAALIENLDLVVTSDTSVAHLAGALGKPVWVLLAFSPDWRWLLDRTDSPWYPTMKLFRQENLGDWDGVIQAVRRKLARDVAV